jgi:hypothetical protein
MKISTFIATCLGFLAFNLSAIAADAMVPNTYRASTVTGSVTWQDSGSGESKALLADQVLPVGAIINTGDASRVILVFSTGATAVIGEKSQVVVSKLQQELFGEAAANDPSIEPSVSNTEITLNKGTITNRVSKLRAQSSFVVKTPIGVAGVRGTTFQVSYDPISKVLRVLTAEGKVVFNTTANVELPVDGGTDITLYFETDAAGEIGVIRTENGVLTRVEIQEILGLVGGILGSETPLRPLNPNQPILSDDTP